MRVAAQLYTLRDYMQTEEEIETGLKRLGEMGYKAVQVSGIGSIDPHRLKEIVDREGLTICATHNSLERLENDLEAVVTEHKLWDCQYVGLGAMPGKYTGSEEGYRQFARVANQIGARLKEKDLQFVYHNHNFEFEKFGENTGLEILMEYTDPELVYFEIDTYWVQAGGASPDQWINKLADRMGIVHFKDMAVDGWEPIMAEVGEGNLNWPAIIAACKKGDVEWAAVEQDKCQRNPFESLKISLDNLKKMGL